MTTLDGSQDDADNAFLRDVNAYLERERQKENQRKRDRLAAEQIARMEALLASGQAQFTGARNHRAERITDVTDALEMQQNRAICIVTQRVAQQLFTAMVARTEGERDRILRDVVESLERGGGLWKSYALPDEERRISDCDTCVCVRAGAEILDPSTAEFQPFACGAEMRTRLAPQNPDPKKPFITPVPHPSDKSAFYEFSKDQSGSKKAQAIHDRPSRIAEIEDVYTYKKFFERHKVASYAREKARTIVVDDINPARGPRAQIDTLIANMFRLESMRLLDGSKRGISLPRPAVNERSIKMHALTRNPGFAAYPVWSHPVEPLAITFKPDPSSKEEIEAELGMGWETVAMDMK